MSKIERIFFICLCLVVFAASVEVLRRSVQNLSAPTDANLTDSENPKWNMFKITDSMYMAVPCGHNMEPMYLKRIK